MSTFDAKDASTPGFYKPTETALLLLDFHSLFVERVAGAKAESALAAAAKVTNWARSLGFTVVHGLIDSTAQPLDTTKNPQRLNGILAIMKAGGAEESPILMEGAPAGEKTFFRRPGYISALSSPGIKEFLQEQGIKSLIITGLSTSGCVLRTTIPATDLDYIVTVLSDACADSDDDLHNTLVEKVLPSRAYVTTSQEFMDGYEKVQN
jgi:nicotinamidase-related amidase